MSAVETFKIGDLVLFGGKVSGRVAYIGATQFQPGEWAGTPFTISFDHLNHTIHCYAPLALCCCNASLTPTMMPACCIE